MLAIIRSDGERHGKENCDSYKEENQDAKRRQAETVSQWAAQTAVGNPSLIGLQFIQKCRLLPFQAGGARSRARVEIKRGKIDETGHQDEGSIIPCQPVAIVKLLVPRYRRLREVMGRIIRGTAVVVAAVIGQGKVLDTGVVKNTVHDQVVRYNIEPLRDELSIQGFSYIWCENVETAKLEA